MHTSREEIALKARVTASTFLLAAAFLHDLIRKANFNPNQPRAPRGRREGGRWTRDGAGTPQVSKPRPTTDTNEDGSPRLPEERPSSSRERYLFSRQLAQWLFDRGLDSSSFQIALATIRAGHWIHENAPAIRSYLDRPKTLSELQSAARRPRPGYETHHIVEKDAARREGFRESLIEGENNRVLVPTFRHKDITAWFMTSNDDFGGLSPREYLRDKSWEERKRVGLIGLIESGVLKP